MIDNVPSNPDEDRFAVQIQGARLSINIVRVHVEKISEQGRGPAKLRLPSMSYMGDFEVNLSSYEVKLVGDKRSTRDQMMAWKSRLFDGIKVERQVSGFSMCGGASEMMALTPDEVIRFLKSRQKEDCVPLQSFTLCFSHEKYLERLEKILSILPRYLHSLQITLTERLIDPDWYTSISIVRKYLPNLRRLIIHDATGSVKFTSPLSGFPYLQFFEYTKPSSTILQLDNILSLARSVAGIGS